MWWLSGIFRDVTLIGRPAGAVDDVFVHADYDHVAGTAQLCVEASTAVRVADLADHGLGLASCGPGVLPGYRLDPAPFAFGLLFRSS